MAFCKDCKAEVDPHVENDEVGEGPWAQQTTAVSCPECGGQELFNDEGFTVPFEYEGPEPLDDYD